MLNIGRGDALERIAHLLCELSLRANAIGGDPRNFTLQMTQDDLADATGLTGIHVNRMLRVLREQGFVEIRKGEVEIIDPRGLATVGNFDDAYLHLKREPIPPELR